MDENFNTAAEIEELPWLVFTLNGNAYAVNSRYVDGIEMLTENITPLPDAPDLFRGLVKRRGEVYPLLDMRKVFHFLSVDEETAEFMKTMEQRKVDHTNWLKRLEECVHSGEKFELATDPHKCAFGMWYDEFIKDNRSSAMHLKKVEEPHRLLHESAHTVLEAAKNGDMETADKLIQKAWKDYYPKIIATLDDAEHAFRSTFRETVVVLADGSQILGLLVDEVLAVDKIEPVNGSSNINLLLQSKFFEGTARNSRFDYEILIVNEKELFRLSDANKSVLQG